GGIGPAARATPAAAKGMTEPATASLPLRTRNSRRSMGACYARALTPSAVEPVLEREVGGEPREVPRISDRGRCAHHRLDRAPCETAADAPALRTRLDDLLH